MDWLPPVRSRMPPGIPAHIAGLQQIRDSLGASVSQVEARTPAEQEEALRTYAAQGYTWCSATASNSRGPQSGSRRSIPEPSFIVTSGERVARNVSPLIFRLSEASYLAGMVAGGMTRTNTIAFVGGIELPPIKLAEDAWVAGAKAGQSRASVARSTYLNTFDDVAAGREAALALLQAGADMFHHNADQAALGHLSGGEGIAERLHLRSQSRSGLAGAGTRRRLCRDRSAARVPRRGTRGEGAAGSRPGSNPSGSGAASSDTSPTRSSRRSSRRRCRPRSRPPGTRSWPPNRTPEPPPTRRGRDGPRGAAGGGRRLPGRVPPSSGGTGRRQCAQRPSGRERGADYPNRRRGGCLPGHHRRAGPSGSTGGAGPLLLVHHGLFWDGSQPLTGRRYRRVRALLGHGAALYSAHIPLDLHPDVGNNIGLARHAGPDRHPLVRSA